MKFEIRKAVDNIRCSNCRDDILEETAFVEEKMGQSTMCLCLPCSLGVMGAHACSVNKTIDQVMEILIRNGTTSWKEKPSPVSEEDEIEFARRIT